MVPGFDIPCTQGGIKHGGCGHYRQLILDEAIAEVEKFSKARSEIGALFDAGWNSGNEATLEALRKLKGKV